MRNYIKILNFSEFPEVKGLVVQSGRMIRTFCSCGFVDCSVVHKCPDCGNENFINNTKTFHGDRLIATPNSSYSDPYSILHFAYGYDIRKTQSATTSIVKNSRHGYTNLISQCTMSVLKPFMDTEEFKSVPVYAIAQNICNDINNEDAWRHICRFCFKVKDVHPDEFNERFVRNIIDSIGADDLVAKVECYNNYGYQTQPKEIISIMEKFSPITYALCENSYVFDKLVCRGGHKSIKNVPEAVQEVLYAYWRGGYVPSRMTSEILQAMYEVGINNCNTDCVIRFFKEEYALMQNNINRVPTLREYLTEIQHKSMSNKEFFLAKSQKRIKSSFKKSADLNDLFSDVYTDPTSVFIKLANMEKH